MLTPEQEKRLLDAWYKTTDKIGKIITKNISQEVIDNWCACADVISKCESVKSKYYIHKYKGDKSMDLIDRDELELDTEWSDWYDGFTSYSQSQINGAVEVQAILLDKVKKARGEIENINEVVHDGQNHYYKDCVETKKEVLAILDKLIESEG